MNKHSYYTLSLLLSFLASNLIFPHHYKPTWPSCSFQSLKTFPCHLLCEGLCHPGTALSLDCSAETGSLDTPNSQSQSSSHIPLLLFPEHCKIFHASGLYLSSPLYLEAFAPAVYLAAPLSSSVTSLSLLSFERISLITLHEIQLSSCPTPQSSPNLFTYFFITTFVLYWSRVD